MSFNLSRSTTEFLRRRLCCVRNSMSRFEQRRKSLRMGCNSMTPTRQRMWCKKVLSMMNWRELKNNSLRILMQKSKDTLKKIRRIWGSYRRILKSKLRQSMIKRLI
jgi:hypothetical protein